MRRRLVLQALPQLHGQERESLPGFELTFMSEGHDYKAFVRARSAQAATEEGLIELAQQCPDFDPDQARLTRSVQVR